MNAKTIVSSMVAYVTIFAVGWIANIIQIVTNLPPTLAETTGVMMVKIVGVFVAPLGAIMGFVGFF
jgi:hypothetical protein